MIQNKSVLAIIPARGGSKGLPGKNIMPMNGKPLLGWPINAAKNSKYVDKVIVSTDDRNIADIAKDEGAEVPYIRPAELAQDHSTSFSVIKHAIEHFKGAGQRYDYTILLEPTSPLTESRDIDRALEMLDASRSTADSIVGVCENENRHPDYNVLIRDNILFPLKKGQFSQVGRRQDLEKLYYFEGSLYISDTDVLLQNSGFYHHRTMAYVVPKWKAFEVDDLVDFICIEAIMKNKSSF